MICKYKEIFGKVNQGIHSYSIYDLAVIDILFTIILAFIINNNSHKHSFYNFFVILILLFILGIISHRFFCVRKTIDKFIFY